MAAPKGNKFWQARSTHGRKPIFETPEQLWDACEQYFQWVEDNPLKEEKVFPFKGQVTRAEVSKMRAMTLTGLQNFLDIAESTWAAHRVREGFEETVARVERIIYDQKFTGAAADLLNANIIARDLGLKDQRQVEDITPVAADKEKRRSRIEELLSRGLLNIRKSE